MKLSITKLTLLILMTLIGQTALGVTPTSLTVSTGTKWGTASDVSAAGDGKILRLYSNNRARLQVLFTFPAIDQARHDTMRFY